MAEIRVPVTAPGATEAAAQVRTFKTQVVEQGAAAEKTAAANKGLATTTGTVGKSSAEASAYIQKQIALLHAEAAALKKVQAAAMEAGAAREHGNGRALSKLARNIGGKDFSEVVEGAHKAGGSGVGAAFGVATIGAMAGLGVAEIINSIREKETEAANNLVESAIKMSDAMERAEKAVASFGTEAMAKHGDAELKLTAFGGSGALAAGRKYAKDQGDDTGLEAYADAMQRFPDAAMRGHALDAAGQAHKMGLGSTADFMKKLNMSRISRAMAGGGINKVLMEELGSDGVPISEDQFHKMFANTMAGTPESAAIDATRRAKEATDATKQGYQGRAVGAALAETAGTRVPAIGEALKEIRPLQDRAQVLQAQIERGENGSTLDWILSKTGSRTTPKQELANIQDQIQAMMDKAMPRILSQNEEWKQRASEAAHALGEALSAPVGGDGAPQTGSAP